MSSVNYPVVECVPNFSEGRNKEVIDEIVKSLGSKVKLLDVDMGYATNRTVVTFIGRPEDVLEAAFQSMKKAQELIDMSVHQGEHPRFGATDVMPLIPVANISMEECVSLAHALAKRAGDELGYPIYCYEHACREEKRRNLASVRSGEYEGLEEKLKDPSWSPDFGPCRFVAKTGSTAVGARDFLIAVNFNLNTTSVRRANAVAFDCREQGRVLREGGRVTGTVLKDENGVTLRSVGTCKGTKAIGWFIEEYGICQVSMNICRIEETPLHVAFDEVCKSATSRGLRVTGTEIVGCVPLRVLTDAGKYFLKKQQRSLGVPQKALLQMAIQSMGLSELKAFNPKESIIEFRLTEGEEGKSLMDLSGRDFVYEVGSEKAAPGGGSVSAYVGSLGVALGSMVGNLSSHKRGWDDRWEEYSAVAERGFVWMEELMRYVDEDTKSFEAIMDAFKMKKGTQERKDALAKAYRAATEVPLNVMKTIQKGFDIFEQMEQKGMQSSLSDVGVGVQCAVAGIRGAYLNVKINLKEMAKMEGQEEFVKQITQQAQQIIQTTEKFQKEMWEKIMKKLQ